VRPRLEVQNKQFQTQTNHIVFQRRCRFLQKFPRFRYLHFQINVRVTRLWSISFLIFFGHQADHLNFSGQSLNSWPCHHRSILQPRTAVLSLALSLQKSKMLFTLSGFVLSGLGELTPCACGFVHNLIIQQLLIAKHCMPACDGSPYSWTQFANDTDSSIEPQLFEPAFCTDTEVCIAKTDCSNLQITLCDRLSMQIGDFVKDALQQTAKCDHRRFFLQLFLRCVSRNFGRCVHVTGLASEVNILGRVLHRSINQHRSSKHLARIRQLRRLVKETITLGMDHLMTRTFLLCVSLSSDFCQMQLNLLLNLVCSEVVAAVVSLPCRASISCAMLC
jgi:hypothetical protein